MIDGKVQLLELTNLVTLDSDGNHDHAVGTQAFLTGLK